MADWLHLSLFLFIVPSTFFLSCGMQAVCQDPRRSDVYHLAVNLLDRYLSYETVKAERDFLAVSGACAMISMKIRGARKECLNYDQLRYYFTSSERSIRVSQRSLYMISSLLCSQSTDVTVPQFRHTCSHVS